MQDNRSAFKAARGVAEPKDNGVPAGLCGGGNVDHAATADYIAELTAELSTLAKRYGFGALGYLLDMARLEAENAGRHASGRR